MINNFTVNYYNISVYNDEDAMFVEVYQIFHQIILFSSLIPGIAFNIITIVIFYYADQFWENGNTMGFCMIIQLLTANVVLIAKIITSSGFILFQTQHFKCGFNNFIEISINCFACFVHLLVTVDRFVVIKYSSKTLQLFKKKRNICTCVGLLFLLSLSVAFPTLFGSHDEELHNYFKNSRLLTGIPECDYTKNQRILFVFLLIIFRIGPIFIMMIMNTLLTRELVKSKLRLSSTRSLRREYRFGIALILMNFILFLASLPTFFVFVYGIFFHSFKTIILIRFCTWYIIIFESFHLFYNLTFNKTFRKEFFNIILCI
jgi:hypothetical protein